MDSNSAANKAATSISASSQVAATMNNHLQSNQQLKQVVTVEGVNNMAALASQQQSANTNTNPSSMLSSSQQHSSRGTGGTSNLQSSLPPSGKHPQQYQNNNSAQTTTLAASINNLNLMKLNDEDSNNSNFKSPGHQSAATGDDTIPPFQVKAQQQFPPTNNSSNSANSKSVKRVLNEQITQPLSSSSRHQQQQQFTASGGPNNFQRSSAVNEVPNSSQKKQRKFKDNDSSPGLPFRGANNMHLGIKQSESLRSNQKLFSGLATNPKRSTMKSYAGPGMGVDKLAPSGGPSAQITDMHRTSGSPSKAAKVANITYHHGIRSGSGQLDQSNLRQTQSSMTNKKTSSRNSATLTHANTGKTASSIIMSSGLHESHNNNLADNHPQHQPTNNINSIVMQTSPAKFFQAQSIGSNSANKKTLGVMRGANGLGDSQPEQPSISAGQLGPSIHLQNPKSTSIISGMVPNNNNVICQQEKSAIQAYGAPESGNGIRQQQQHLMESNNNQNQQQFTLFQPSQLLQQQQLLGQQSVGNGKIKPQSVGLSSGPSSANVGSSQCATSQQQPGPPPREQKQHVTQQQSTKHYSQVVMGGHLASSGGLNAGIPTNSEKTNSLSSLQQQLGAQQQQQQQPGATQAYTGYQGQKPSEGMKKPASGSLQSYGSAQGLASSQIHNFQGNSKISVHPLDNNNNCSMISPDDSTPGTGTAAITPHSSVTVALKQAQRAGSNSITGPKTRSSNQQHHHQSSQQQLSHRTKKDHSLKQAKRGGINLNSSTANNHSNQSFSFSVSHQNSQRQLLRKPTDSKSLKPMTATAKSSTVEDTDQFPNLTKFLLRGHIRNKTQTSQQNITATDQQQQDTQSTGIKKKGASTLRTSLSQIVTPLSINSASNKTATAGHNKRTNNWMSPRQRKNNPSSSAQKQTQQQFANTLASASREFEESAASINNFSESQVSEQIRSVKRDMQNQHVIKADAERARFISKDYREQLQQMMTYFCKEQGLSYKQGINDVMAPFLWLAIEKHKKKLENSKRPRTTSSKKKQKGQLQNSFTQENVLATNSACEGQINLEEPLVMAKEFMQTYQTNLFIDDDFYALQSCLILLKMLLTYHDPIIIRHLERNNVIPEMYCIPWFITYFASRMETAELVLQFWDRVMQGSPDQDAGHQHSAANVTFIFFFAVALVIFNKTTIMKSDQADLPQTMTQLSVKSAQELDQLIKLAEELEENTPFSFRQLDELKSIFKRQNSAQLKQISQSLESMSCMPVLPAELFFYAFPGEIECPNPECLNSLTWKQTKNGGNFLPLAPNGEFHSDGVAFNDGLDCAYHQTLMNHNQGNDDKGSSNQILSESDDRAGQSGMSSFAGGSSANNSLLIQQQQQQQQQFSVPQRGRASNLQKNSAGHPLETESNLNYEQDHQESPIDLINETAKMKHLSQEDFKSFSERQFAGSSIVSSGINNTFTNHNPGCLSEEQFAAVQVEQNNNNNNNNMMMAQEAQLRAPSLCLKCTQRQRVMHQLEQKRDQTNQAKNNAQQQKKQAVSMNLDKSKDQQQQSESSFEDLSTDLLYSKFRFVIVDCRLNILQQEVALPYCISFEVLAASQAEHLVSQIESLVDYKDNYHICLLGLDRNEEQMPEAQNSSRKQSSPDKNSKISIRQFHEYVLRFMTSELIKQGFKYVSTLPAGFQQVHDLAQVFGFQLIDHGDQHAAEAKLISQNNEQEDMPIDCPITVSLTNCYHCLTSRNRKRTLEHQNSMVVKKYGSMVNTLDNSSLGSRQQHSDLHLEKRDRSSILDEPSLRHIDDDDMMVEAGQHTTGQETTAYQGQKFDLSGFSDYFPFGLKQVYAAASSINQMLQANREEEAKISEPSSPEGGNLKSGLDKGPRSTNDRGLERLNEISRSRYRQIHINPAAIPRQQSSESAYVGSKGHLLTNNTLNPGLARSAGKSSGSACRKTATYQNQQHLQLQSNYKLLSKVPDFKSQFLVNKDQQSQQVKQPTGVNHRAVLSANGTEQPEFGGDNHEQLSVGDVHVPTRFSQMLVNQREVGGGKATSEVHRYSSPVRRNRPRITNEVQSTDKDLAQILQRQQQKHDQLQQQDRSGPILDENVPAKNVNRMNLSNVNNNQNINASEEFKMRQPPLSQSHVVGDRDNEGQGITTETQSGLTMSWIGSRVSSVVDTQVSDSLPIYSPMQESYMLNGIVRQVSITQQNYEDLLSRYETGHLFFATRLPARKRTFQLQSQLSFNLQIPSSILITPFTVAIIQKGSEIRKAMTEQPNQIQESQLGPELFSKYAVLQSRFFMYDLIKITSRKSTTKIITFYYRIPKKSEYDERVLEDNSMINSLNRKPQCSYLFAFKRAEFEEVSMSFEFEREDDAKECIQSVSALYKQLKDTSKKSTRRSTNATTATVTQAGSNSHQARPAQVQQPTPQSQSQSQVSQSQSLQKKDKPPTNVNSTAADPVLNLNPASSSNINSNIQQIAGAQGSQPSGVNGTSFRKYSGGRN